MIIVNPIRLVTVAGGKFGEGLTEENSAFLENSKNVIFSAHHIEDRLSAGIGRYFFGDSVKDRTRFDELILSTDFFTFSAKRKVFMKIVMEQRLLTSSAFSDFDKVVAKVVKYRNMFTHGVPVWTKNGCELHYHEGGNAIRLITDDFLREVERNVSEAFKCAEDIVPRIARAT